MPRAGTPRFGAVSRPSGAPVAMTADSLDRVWATQPTRMFPYPKGVDRAVGTAMDGT